MVQNLPQLGDDRNESSIVRMTSFVFSVRQFIKELMSVIVFLFSLLTMHMKEISKIIGFPKNREFSSS